MTAPGDGRLRPVAEAPPRPTAGALIAWGTLLGALAAVQAAFGGGLLSVLLQAGAGAVSLAVGAAILVAGGRRPPGGVRAAPALSLASALAGVSAAAIVCGATVGSWLVIGGVLGLGLAAGGLVRERRAERRALRLAARRVGGEG